MSNYKIRFKTFDEIKKFIYRIGHIESDANIRSEGRKYGLDAKSLHGILSLDISKDLILEINGNEENFIKDIGDMGIYIEPISVGV